MPEHMPDRMCEKGPDDIPDRMPETSPKQNATSLATKITPDGTRLKRPFKIMIASNLRSKVSWHCLKCKIKIA